MVGIKPAQTCARQALYLLYCCLGLWFQIFRNTPPPISSSSFRERMPRMGLYAWEGAITVDALNLRWLPTPQFPQAPPVKQLNSPEEEEEELNRVIQDGQWCLLGMELCKLFGLSPGPRRKLMSHNYWHLHQSHPKTQELRPRRKEKRA